MHQGWYGRDTAPAARPLFRQGDHEQDPRRHDEYRDSGRRQHGSLDRHPARQVGGAVTLTDRDLGKAESVVAGIAGDGVSAADVSATLASEIVVLALWYPGTTDFAAEHAAELDGKIVIDISNPLDESWVRLATDSSTSSAELLAQQLPGSRIVKAFNTTHAPALADGQVEE